MIAMESVILNQIEKQMDLPAGSMRSAYSSEPSTSGGIPVRSFLNPPPIVIDRMVADLELAKLKRR